MPFGSYGKLSIMINLTEVCSENKINSSDYNQKLYADWFDLKEEVAVGYVDRGCSK